MPSFNKRKTRRNKHSGGGTCGSKLSNNPQIDITDIDITGITDTDIIVTIKKKEILKIEKEILEINNALSILRRHYKRSNLSNDDKSIIEDKSRRVLHLKNKKTQEKLRKEVELKTIQPNLCPEDPDLEAEFGAELNQLMVRHPEPTSGGKKRKSKRRRKTRRNKHSVGGMWPFSRSKKKTNSDKFTGLPGVSFDREHLYPGKLVLIPPNIHTLSPLHPDFYKNPEELAKEQDNIRKARIDFAERDQRAQHWRDPLTGDIYPEPPRKPTPLRVRHASLLGPYIKQGQHGLINPGPGRRPSPHFEKLISFQPDNYGRRKPVYNTNIRYSDITRNTNLYNRLEYQAAYESAKEAYMNDIKMANIEPDEPPRYASRDHLPTVLNILPPAPPVNNTGGKKRKSKRRRKTRRR